jgi:hypothetical protein
VDDWLGWVTDPQGEAIVRLLGLDPTRDRRTLLEFLAIKKEADDAFRRLGPDNVARILDPVTDIDLKKKLMAEHLQEERAWVAIESRLGIPYMDQTKVIMHNRIPNRLLLWDDDRRTDFELDVRDHMRQAELCRRYDDVGVKTVRTLRHMFLGEI